VLFRKYRTRFITGSVDNTGINAVSYPQVLTAIYSLYWLSYGLDDRDSVPGRGREFLSPPPNPHRLWDPPSNISNGWWELLPPGLKWQEREDDSSTPSSAEFKNAWSCISTPPHVFMALCLIKYRISVHGMVLSYIYLSQYLTVPKYLNFAVYNILVMYIWSLLRLPFWAHNF